MEELTYSSVSTRSEAARHDPMHLLGLRIFSRHCKVRYAKIIAHYQGVEITAICSCNIVYQHR